MPEFIKIKAIYKGSNHPEKSLGFNRKEEYHLTLTKMGESIRISNRKKSDQVCVYSNIFMFLENWTNVQSF